MIAAMQPRIAGPGADMDDDREAILDLIERETTAFLCRDFDAWADCLIHDDGMRRIGALVGGTVAYHEGWEVERDTVREFMERFPDPNPIAARTMRRTNISLRIHGAMAWVSFDQYGERSEDPLVSVGLSHQVRIVENRAGAWKIAMIAFGDTTLEYYDFPVIRIDENARIDWMNDQGRVDLSNHPALTRSGPCLRGRYPSDDRRLQDAIREVAGRGVVDWRATLAHPRGRMADPVVLTGAAADGQHIVWISKQDGMLLVSFRDTASEQARLEQAAELFDLSPAQTRLAGMILEGHDLAEIAARLAISPNTAKTHLTRIFDKTGARSQSALVSRLLGIRPPR